jgi:outer membrane protein TolC
MSLPLDSFNLTQEEMTQGLLGISQMIPGGDKRRLERETQSRLAERDAATLEVVRRGIVREVSLAWLEVWYPGAALKQVREIELEYRRQVDWAQATLAANRLSAEEALAQRMMLEYARDQIADRSRALARARAALSRWLGEEARRPVPDEVPDGGPLAGAPSPESVPDAHPELAALRHAEAAARAEADLAREAYKPDWNVDVTYGARGGDRADLLSAVVSVDLPLFTAKRQDKRLAGKLAAEARARNETEDRRLQIKADLAVARADWESATQRVAHHETALLPLAERRVDAALAAYRAGKSSFAQVLDARRAKLEARLSLLELQAARARAAVEIAYLAAAPE